MPSLFTKMLKFGEGKNRKVHEDVVTAVDALEGVMSVSSDEELRAKGKVLEQRAAAGAAPDELEAEAYALIREVAWRVLGQKPYPVQIQGAVGLGRGFIAEMRTGEGKTLAATMPSYLHALYKRGVHVVTVNDYLAKRDAEWMGEIHRFLGMQVGLIQSPMTPEERRPAYAADITYGTNNEFGFDYLRDNMALRTEELVQRGHYYAIIDEVDSILVDEARTPLIIAGSNESEEKWFRELARIVDRLEEGRDYEVDIKKRQVLTMEDGVTRVEKALGVENLFAAGNTDFVRHLDVALKAKTLFTRDVEYLVDQGEVKIVDEFTGRVLDGRRYSEGLHQAIEAKEGVLIQAENQTLATITLQNYFRMYENLSGMTGTALTEESEFHEIYGLSVIEIPTNQPVVRIDQPDLIFQSEAGKWQRAVADIAERHQAGQPVLVGTISIDNSELISGMLTKAGVPHEVLNAKQHTREAEIVAQAGRHGAVTVATNMAGRGVDIALGGNIDELVARKMLGSGLKEDTPEWDTLFTELQDTLNKELAWEREQVLEAGGLYVIGTERHESRRIDNQLRGRSGRQGDPGESRFYLSVEDELMRRFGGDKIGVLMSRMNLAEDEPIENKMITKAVERAQNQIEEQNFEIRKDVLKYDEVVNKQRQVVYAWRNDMLHDGAQDLVERWIVLAGEALAEELCENGYFEGMDPETARLQIATLFDSRDGLVEELEGEDLDTVRELIVADVERVYAEKVAEFGEHWPGIVQNVALQIIDARWQEHLGDLDHMRDAVNLRAIGQQDPLVEYQRESFEFYEDMIVTVRHDVVRYLLHVHRVAAPPQTKKQRKLTMNRNDDSVPVTRRVTKIGRNAPCPCGSGKKYKRCHGAPGAEPLQT